MFTFNLVSSHVYVSLKWISLNWIPSLNELYLCFVWGRVALCCPWRIYCGENSVRIGIRFWSIFEVHAGLVPMILHLTNDLVCKHVTSSSGYSGAVYASIEVKSLKMGADINYLKMFQRLSTRIMRGHRKLLYDEAARKLRFFSLERRHLTLATTVSKAKIGISISDFLLRPPSSRLWGQS